MELDDSDSSPSSSSYMDENDCNKDQDEDLPQIPQFEEEETKLITHKPCTLQEYEIKNIKDLDAYF